MQQTPLVSGRCKHHFFNFHFTTTLILLASSSYYQHGVRAEPSSGPRAPSAPFISSNPTSSLTSNNNAVTMPIPLRASQKASRPIPAHFVSFSIELSSFPDFAGNTSHPNKFSDTLLDNIGLLQGGRPVIRVGGNTQDYALFNGTQDQATKGIIDPRKSPDYPTTLSIGPSFFESYTTFRSTKFIHGFNLGKNGSASRESLLASVPVACKALQGGGLLYWELGNEPDVFKTSGKGIVRPRDWSEKDYAAEWLNGTRAIRKVMADACPGLASTGAYKYVAPSFAGTRGSIDPIRVWENGLNADLNIAQISMHNYIGGATQPGITLQGTLMNHSMTVASVAKHLNVSRRLASYDLPYILGEMNSLYNQGRPGLSNSFGAALWGLDFNLYCASQNISRVHMHQGTNYRYASWQPIQTDNATMGTKPPYYGNIAVGAMMGNLSAGQVQIQHLPMQREREAAYAAFVDGTLKRVMVINMMGFNYSSDMNETARRRPEEVYEFQLPTSCMRNATVQRLMANGSNAISGITWNGVSFNWELEEGHPVVLGNVTRDENAPVTNEGIVKVGVPWSSAAMVRVDCALDLGADH